MSKLNDVLKRIGYNNPNDVRNDLWAVKHDVDGKSQPSKPRPKSKIRARHIPYSHCAGHSAVTFNPLDLDSQEYIQSHMESYESKLFDEYY